MRTTCSAISLRKAALAILLLFFAGLLSGCGVTGESAGGWSSKASIIGASEVDPVSYDDLASVFITFYETTDTESFTASFSLPGTMQAVQKSVKSIYIPGQGDWNNVQAVYHLLPGDASPGMYSATVEASAGGSKASFELEVEVAPSEPSLIVWGLGSVPRYVDYPSINVELENPRDEHSSGVEITATCWNVNTSSVKSYFRTAVGLAPGERRTVSVPHSSGWPYFIDGDVACRFSGRHKGELLDLDYPEDLLPESESI